MASTVPDWKVTRVPSKRAYVKVTCPRRDCGHSFWVHAATWATPVTPREQEHGLTTRSCPFCFRANWIPNRRPPEG